MRFAQISQYLKEKSSLLTVRILVINLLSLLVLSIFNYVAFYNTTTKVFLESVMAYNQRVSNIAFGNIDQQIMRSIAAIPSLFFSDIRTNDAILLPQTQSISQSPYQIQALRTKVNDIYTACSAIHEINIYYEATDTVVTGSGNLHFVQSDSERALYLPWYTSFEAMNQSTAVMLLSSAQLYPKDTSAQAAFAPKDIISFVTKIHNPKWRGKSIVIATHLSTSRFAAYLDEQQGQFIVAGQDGEIIYSTPGGQSAPQEIIGAVAETMDSTIRLDDLGVVVSYSSNPALQLRYYYVLPYSVFLQDYNPTLQMLILNYILSVLFTCGVLLLISYLSNATYRKRLAASSQKAGLELPSRFEPFDLSLDAITNQLSTLNAVVAQTRPMLYRNYLRSLILGRSSAQAYEQVAPLMVYPGIFCLIVNLSSQDSAGLNLDAVYNDLTNQADGYTLLLTTLEQNEIAIVVNTSQPLAEQVCHTLNQRIETLFAKSYTADGQWMEVDSAGFKTAFASAQTIYRYHFVYPQHTQLHYEHINPLQTKHTGSHLKLFSDIEKDILSENLLDLRHKLSALTESFKFGSYSIDYCSSTLRDFVTMLYNLTQNRQLDMWVAFGYDIRAHYKQIADIDEFYRWSCELCEILMLNIRQRKRSINPDLQSRLLALIEKNLENNISLEFLADQLMLRPDVLSRTFKQLMGKSYIDYVKEKKMLRARELIAQDYSMKEIAHRLGYNSTQYFIKIFKETYGTTPCQYKKHGLPT